MGILQCVHVLPYSSLDIGMNLVKNEIPTNAQNSYSETTTLGDLREIILNTHQCVYIRIGYTLEFTCDQKKQSIIVCRQAHACSKRISRTKGENDYEQKGERMRLVSVLWAYVEYKQPDGTRFECAVDKNEKTKTESVFLCAALRCWNRPVHFDFVFFFWFRKRVCSCHCSTHLVEVQMFGAQNKCSKYADGFHIQAITWKRSSYVLCLIGWLEHICQSVCFIKWFSSFAQCQVCIL